MPGFFCLSGAREVVGLLAAAVVLHVLGLWITSPPDVVDSLLFTSPTPFSPFGVIAMWAVFAAALVAACRRRMGLRPGTWHRLHGVLALLIVTGSVAHALFIEGTMEPFSAWDQVFPDPAVTVAAVDRLVHHAAILDMNVDSCRRRAAEKRRRDQADRPATPSADNPKGAA